MNSLLSENQGDTRKSSTWKRRVFIGVVTVLVAVFVVASIHIYYGRSEANAYRDDAEQSEMARKAAESPAQKQPTTPPNPKILPAASVSTEDRVYGHRVVRGVDSSLSVLIVDGYGIGWTTWASKPELKKQVLDQIVGLVDPANADLIVVGQILGFPAKLKVGKREYEFKHADATRRFAARLQRVRQQLSRATTKPQVVSYYTCSPTPAPVNVNAQSINQAASVTVPAASNVEALGIIGANGPPPVGGAKSEE